MGDGIANISPVKLNRKVAMSAINSNSHVPSYTHTQLILPPSPFCLLLDRNQFQQNKFQYNGFG